MKAEPNRRDQMTPHERRRAMERGEETDRIPVIPFIGEISGRLTGTSSREYWHDAGKMVEADLAAFNRLGHDELSLGPNTCGILEAFGTTVIYPDTGMPYFEGQFLTDYKMLDAMEPIRPEQSGRLLFFREALEQMKEAANEIVDVAPSIGGPFTIAANLRHVLPPFGPPVKWHGYWQAENAFPVRRPAPQYRIRFLHSFLPEFPLCPDLQTPVYRC